MNLFQDPVVYQLNFGIWYYIVKNDEIIYMFFSRNPDPSFLDCYTTERPYTSYDPSVPYSSHESLFVPTVVSDIKLITDYFTTGIPYTRRGTPFDFEQVWIHTFAKAKCLEDGVVSDPRTGDDRSSRWDSYIDHQLGKLEEVGTKDALKVHAQLGPSVDLLKQATFAEYEAQQNELFQLWRFSQKGHVSDIEYLKRHDSSEDGDKKYLNFGDSLLSGYTKDGSNCSDIAEGVHNYGACVFSYYKIHCQGVEAKSNGYITNIFGKTALADLPENYQEYLGDLTHHEVYALTFDINSLANSLAKSSKGNGIHIPESTISSSACFQSGDFHPTIDMFGDVSYTVYELII